MILIEMAFLLSKIEDRNLDLVKLEHKNANYSVVQSASNDVSPKFKNPKIGLAGFPYDVIRYGLQGVICEGLLCVWVQSLLVRALLFETPFWAVGV